MMTVSAHNKSALTYNELGNLKNFKKFSYKYCCNLHSKEIYHKNVPISFSLFYLTDIPPVKGTVSKTSLFC